MFSGIVAETGAVLRLKPAAGGMNYTVTCSRELLSGVAAGSSIAVNGACQTVEEFTDGQFSFFSSDETLARTNFSDFRPGTPVNLERSLTLQTFLDGHLVSGHIDGVGTVVSVLPAGNGHQIFLTVPDRLLPMIAEKGSLAVDGVSLTVNSVAGNRIGLTVIPVSFRDTTLSRLRPGHRVNLEVDIIARYLFRIAGFAGGEMTASEPILEKLRKSGFVQQEANDAGLF